MTTLGAIWYVIGKHSAKILLFGVEMFQLKFLARKF